MPLTSIPTEIEGTLFQGWHVDWAEHDGRLYLRVWEDPEPAWEAVFAERDLVDLEAILREIEQATGKAH